MAAVNTSDPARLGVRGGTLAAIQIAQIGTGLIGQVLLLARWSPDPQTDLFLLVSGVPWLVSAAALVTGLEMALPAAYHRARVAGGDSEARRLIARVRKLSLLASVIATLISSAIVAVWARRSDLEPALSAWMGLALGAQVIPATLGGLWRGALVAEDRLVRARLTLLAGSSLIALGYALLPGPPARALPLVTLSAMLLAAILAGRFAANLPIPSREEGENLTPRPPLHAMERGRWRRLKSPLHWMERGFRGEVNLRLASPQPELAPLLRSLLALSAAAGLVHLQTIIERAAVEPLGTGHVTALAVAGRGWDAILAVIVAASVMPAYPRWADLRARERYGDMRALLRWSLTRAAALSFLAASLIGVAAWQIGPRLNTGLGWDSGAQAARMALVLLPRFALVSAIQPLVLKHYASGTPWYPVIGAALGVGVFAVGALTIIPRYGLPGVTLAAAASAIPGWLVLGWREWRRRP